MYFSRYQRLLPSIGVFCVPRNIRTSWFPSSIGVLWFLPSIWEFVFSAQYRIIMISAQYRELCIPLSIEEVCFPPSIRTLFVPPSIRAFLFSPIMKSLWFVLSISALCFWSRNKFLPCIKSYEFCPLWHCVYSDNKVCALKKLFCGFRCKTYFTKFCQGSAPDTWGPQTCLQKPFGLLLNKVKTCLKVVL